MIKRVFPIASVLLGLYELGFFGLRILHCFFVHPKLEFGNLPTNTPLFIVIYKAVIFNLFFATPLLFLLSIIYLVGYFKEVYSLTQLRLILLLSVQIIYVLIFTFDFGATWLFW